MKATHASPHPPKPWPAALDVHEAIRLRAEEIYIRSGRIPGRDVQNWVQAEKEILGETAGVRPRRKAIVVKVNGVQYVGEYDEVAAAGYTPGEFRSTGPISVRFEGGKMFVKRPNGKELETRIVKKIG